MQSKVVFFSENRLFLIIYPLNILDNPMEMPTFATDEI